ncbi:MAG TPA: MFS transporter [Kofleriaceae bacterium]|nr:MFS transporter [Kofleriaceae bacterium]
MSSSMSFRKLAIVLAVGSFLTGVNLFGLNPFLATIAADLGSSVGVIGQATTAALIIAALTALILGPVSDHWGFRNMLIVGALVMALSNVGTALAFNEWSLILARGPAGISAGVLSALAIGTLDAERSKADQDERRAAITWLESAGALAVIAGVPLLTLIGDFTHWRTVSFLIAICSAALALVYARVVPNVKIGPAGKLSLSYVFDCYRGVVQNRGVVFLQGANLLFSMAGIGSVTYFGAHLMETTDVSLRAVGMQFTWLGVGFVSGNRLVVPLARRFPQRHVMIVLGGAIAGLLVLFFLFATHLFEFMLVSGLFSICVGIAIPLVTIMIIEKAGAASGTVVMLRQCTSDTGAGLGAGVGGLLIGIGGYPSAGVAFAAAAVLGAALVWLGSWARPAQGPADVAPSSPGPT